MAGMNQEKNLKKRKKTPGNSKLYMCNIEAIYNERMWGRRKTKFVYFFWGGSKASVFVFFIFSRCRLTGNYRTAGLFYPKYSSRGYMCVFSLGYMFCRQLAGYVYASD
jgi:hypothetical protein